jgi:SAM-dependent methyltransferase
VTHDLEALGGALTQIDAAPNYNDWLFARARPHLGRRVLDVGAGLGTFTERAAATGAEVVALEPEPAFAARLRERFDASPGVAVIEGAAEAPPDETGTGFDAVLCLNVLEHVRDDGAALRAFRERLAPGGRLLLLVPAHPRLYGGYDRAAGHERRYGREQLRRLLHGAGFDVDALRYVNPVGAIGWLLRVRLRRTADWPSGSFAMFDRLVPVFRPLDRLRLPFGLSLWAVARRAA